MKYILCKKSISTFTVSNKLKNYLIVILRTLKDDSLYINSSSFNTETSFKGRQCFVKSGKTNSKFGYFGLYNLIQIQPAIYVWRD